MDQPTLDLTADPAGDDALTLANYAQRAYLDYAVSVVKGRALPDLADMPPWPGEVEKAGTRNQRTLF